MAKSLDEQIKQALETKGQFSQEETNAMWNGIESELFETSRVKPRARKKRSKKPYAMIAAAAAALLIAFGTQTSTGIAMIDKVKSMFVPEKKVQMQIEGSNEDTQLNLHEGKKSEYVLYVDEERYRFVTGDTSDKVILKETLPEQYPAVEMEIKQLENTAPSEVVNEIKSQLAKQYDEILRVEEVSDPLTGTLITAKKTGAEWNTPLAKTYIISNGSSGSFIITQTLFLEAEEGHGARFDQMLKEFQIVE